MNAVLDHTFDHVGLNVADLNGMSEWYRSAFSMSTDFEFALSGADFQGVMLKNTAGDRIELLHRSGNRLGIQAIDPVEAALTRGFGHLALNVADVDAAYASLLEMGASDRMTPRASPEPGVRMAYVADPEGNLIELLDRNNTQTSTAARV